MVPQYITTYNTGFKRPVRICGSPKKVAEIRIEDASTSGQQASTPPAKLNPNEETQKIDPTKYYLNKLYDRYPSLFKILQKLPPEEVAKKVMQENFRTVYQIDYVKEGYYPTLTEESPKPREEKKDDCGCRHEQCECFKSPVLEIARRHSVITKIPKGFPKPKKGEKVEPKSDPKFKAQVTALKPKSEYAATIGRIGGYIIKENLLAPQGEEEDE